MAISKNPDLKSFRGTIDKKIVVRQYGDKTVLSTYPNMSNIVPTKDQKRQRSIFAKAQKYAMEFLQNPENKAFYKARCTGKQRPHNLLIQDLTKGLRPFPEGYDDQI